MPQIEIDFEVFKALTNLRLTEAVTYNDVVRELLQMPMPPRPDSAKSINGNAWVVSNTSFPVGSEFMTDYKGRTYSGIVQNGRLRLSDNYEFTTPSAAAMHITEGKNVNGWRFWKCKLPGTSRFVLIERLRGKAH